MMKFKLVNNKVTDEREEALNNKVGAECFYIMIAGTLVCLVYSSFFNKGVITSNYLTFPMLIAWIWSIYRSERLSVNTFGGSGMTVLGCLLVTGLITLMIMSATIGTTMMSIIIIPWILDISWFGQLLISYMLPLFSL